MALTSSTADLLFRARGSTEDARAEFSKLKDKILESAEAVKTGATKEFETFASKLTLSEEATKSLAAALPGVGTAVALMGTAIVGAATVAAAALFNLTEKASEYGSVIHDASEKTGLHAETISAMKVAADQSSSSLETITGGIARFAKTVGAANDGNEKAQKSLKLLGVSATDMEAALAQAFKTIQALPPGFEQIAAAQKAFGKSGADLIPFINSFNGDLNALKRQMSDLGLTIDDKAAAAADKFGDTLDTLKSQLAAVGRTIGFELLTEFTKMAKEMSGWLARNKDEWKEWGKAIASEVKTFASGTSTALSGVYNWLHGIYELLQLIGKGFGAIPHPPAGTTQNVSTGTTISTGRFGSPEQAQALSGINPPPVITPANNEAPLPSQFTTDYSRPGDKTKIKTQADLDEEADARKKALAGQLQYLNAREAADKEHLDRNYDQWTEAYKKQAVTEDEFHAAIAENERRYRVAALDDLAKEYANRRSAEELNGDQIKALKLQQATETEKVIAESDKRLIAADNLVTEEKKKRTEETKKLNDEEIKSLTDKLNREVELQEAANQAILAAAKGGETVIANLKGELDLKVLNMKLANLQAELNARKKNGQDTADLENKIEILKEQIAKREIELSGEIVEAIKKEGQAYADKIQKMEESWQKLEDLQHQQELNRVIKPGVDISGEPNQAPGDKPGAFLSGVLSGLGTSIDDLMKPVSVMNELGQMMAQTFGQVASAVGDAVRSFVLLGSAGGSFKKFAAEVLASIAQMAIVQAIWELAQGLAMLALTWFTGNPKYGASAGAHFAAAAVYGTIGGIAAIAGRAVAGNSFQNQTSGAFGAAGPTGNGQASNRAGGTAYSGYGDEATIIDAGRSMPGAGRNQAEVVVTFKDKSNWFSQMFEYELNKNGKLRTLIIDTANA